MISEKQIEILRQYPLTKLQRDVLEVNIKMLKYDITRKIAEDGIYELGFSIQIENTLNKLCEIFA